MKLLHIADLHIGKRVNEFNMIEEQKYALGQILHMVQEEKPHGILISGDVYDKSQPTVEAVELLDEFLTKLTGLNTQIFIISGNHDSPERLEFGSRIMKKNGLHIVGVFNGSLQKEILNDEYGAVNIYLLPFVKPNGVKPYFNEPIESYGEAVSRIISTADININERNILLAHQFVTSGREKPEQSESESLSLGGLDDVDAGVFDSFDYVGLGHLHSPQRIGRDTIRYAGSLLKYSFSEVRHKKSATLVELGNKGDINIRLLPLMPLHDLRKIKGPIEDLLLASHSEKDSLEDYIHATLTDEEEIYDAIGRLRSVYPNLMVMEFENSRNVQSKLSITAATGNVARKSPMDLFAEFYQVQNNNELSKVQCKTMEGIFRQLGGDNL